MYERGCFHSNTATSESVGAMVLLLHGCSVCPPCLCGKLSFVCAPCTCPVTHCPCCRRHLVPLSDSSYGGTSPAPLILAVCSVRKLSLQGFAALWQNRHITESDCLKTGQQAQILLCLIETRISPSTFGRLI